MKLRVSGIGGAQQVIHLDPTDRMKEVKIAIEYAMQIPRNDQRLFLGPRAVSADEDEATLESLGVQHDDLLTVECVDPPENPAQSSSPAFEQASAPTEPPVPDRSTWRLFVSKTPPSDSVSLWIIPWKEIFFYWGAPQESISVEVKHRLLPESEPQLSSSQEARYQELRQHFLFARTDPPLPEQIDCFLSVLELERIGPKAPDGIPFTSSAVHQLCSPSVMQSFSSPVFLQAFCS